MQLAPNSSWLSLTERQSSSAEIVFVSNSESCSFSGLTVMLDSDVKSQLPVSHARGGKQALRWPACSAVLPVGCMKCIFS